MVALPPHVTVTRLIQKKELFLPLGALPHGLALHLHQPTSQMSLSLGLCRILEKSIDPSCWPRIPSRQGIQKDIIIQSTFVMHSPFQHSIFNIQRLLLHIHLSSLSLLPGLFPKVVFHVVTYISSYLRWFLRAQSSLSLCCTSLLNSLPFYVRTVKRSCPRCTFSIVFCVFSFGITSTHTTHTHI